MNITKGRIHKLFHNRKQTLKRGRVKRTRKSKMAHTFRKKKRPVNLQRRTLRLWKMRGGAEGDDEPKADLNEDIKKLVSQIVEERIPEIADKVSQQVFGKMASLAPTKNDVQNGLDANVDAAAMISSLSKDDDGTVIQSTGDLPQGETLREPQNDDEKLQSDTTTSPVTNKPTKSPSPPINRNSSFMKSPTTVEPTVEPTIEPTAEPTVQPIDESTFQETSEQPSTKTDEIGNNL